MNARRRTILQVVTPIVAIATMMIGLRIGARPKVTAAVVVGAAPGRTMSDGRTVLAWQVRAIVEDRGVREAVPGRRIVVTARANGQEAHGQGRTNEDGVVEISLPFDRVAFGDTVAVDVIDDETKATLAHGDARWDPSAEKHGTNTPRGSFLRPTKISGDLELAVAVDGERLVPGFPVSVWIRAATRAARDRSDAAIVHVEPEPGVSFDRDLVTSCENGWAEFHATAHAHVTGATFTANSVQHASTSGTWFGALPVAPGAFFIDVPRVVPRADPGNDATAVSIVAPNPRRTVYVEIDDDRGRVFADAFDLHAKDLNEIPRARFELPALSPGIYRIFASGSPFGGGDASSASALVGKRFVVGEPAGTNVQNACILGPELAATPLGAPAATWTALDGFTTRDESAHGRRLLGIAISLASLGIAAAIEVLLLLSVLRRTKIDARSILEEEDASRASPIGSVWISVLVVLLGFTLLAALISTAK